MRPLILWSRMCRPTSRDRKKPVRRLMSVMASHVASVTESGVSASSRRGLAEWMNSEIVPSFFSAPSSRLFQPSRLPRSAARKSMPSSAGGAVMSLPSTVAPSAKSALAMPRPMPPAQPVTRARSPSRSFVLMLSVSSLEMWSEPMDRTRPTLNQLNIVSGNVDASIAFYRRLGVDIPDPRIWRTATGAHHVTAVEPGATEAAGLDLDSAAFAQIWNKGWAGRKDLAGRVVVGFSVSFARGGRSPLWRDDRGRPSRPAGAVRCLLGRALRHRRGSRRHRRRPHESDLGQAPLAAAGSLMAKTRLDVAWSNAAWPRRAPRRSAWSWPAWCSRASAGSTSRAMPSRPTRRSRCAASRIPMSRAAG